jgi:hypothetical protein
LSPDLRDATVRIRRCSAVSCQFGIVIFHTIPKDPETGKTAKLVRFEVSGSLADVGVLFSAQRPATFLDRSNSLHAATPEAVLRHLVGWRGSDNVHHRAGKVVPDPSEP